MIMDMSRREDQIKAMSSEVRMEILRLLRDAKQHFSHQETADPEAFGVCINLITEKLQLAQPTVSRHIDILKRAGFITVQRYQKWSYCRRDEAALSEYRDWLSETLSIA